MGARGRRGLGGGLPASKFSPHPPLYPNDSPDAPQPRLPVPAARSVSLDVVMLMAAAVSWARPAAASRARVLVVARIVCENVFLPEMRLGRAAKFHFLSLIRQKNRMAYVCSPSVTR